MKKLIPAKDKLTHLYFGVIIYAIISFLSPLIAITAVYISSAGKELIYDKLMKKRTVEFMYFIWTVAIPTLLFLQYMIR